MCSVPCRTAVMEISVKRLAAHTIHVPHPRYILSHIPQYDLSSLTGNQVYLLLIQISVLQYEIYKFFHGSKLIKLNPAQFTIWQKEYVFCTLL